MEHTQLIFTLSTGINKHIRNVAMCFINLNFRSAFIILGKPKETWNFSLMSTINQSIFNHQTTDVVKHLYSHPNRSFN